MTALQGDAFSDSVAHLRSESDAPGHLPPWDALGTPPSLQKDGPAARSSRCTAEESPAVHHGCLVCHERLVQPMGCEASSVFFLQRHPSSTSSYHNFFNNINPLRSAHSSVPLTLHGVNAPLCDALAMRISDSNATACMQVTSGPVEGHRAKVALLSHSAHPALQSRSAAEVSGPLPK